MGITKVQFRVHSGEDYNAALAKVRASPGWMEMVIVDVEAWAEGDPVGEMTAYFDSDANAMFFRLKMGI